MSDFTGRIVEKDRSVIPACDFKDLNDLRNLVEQTHDIEGVGAYKVGSILAISNGLPNAIKVIREFTDLPVIYDHQKAMTDIPEIGEEFVKVVKTAGAKALIGFPQSGPETQEIWIKACKDAELEVIIGGEMTHKRYKQSDGGYISDLALDEMYLNGAKFGVKDFVVPANKIERVIHYRSLLENQIGNEISLYTLGFLSQGGIIADIKKIAGKSWHVIIGRAIYNSKDPRTTTKEIVKLII